MKLGQRIKYTVRYQINNGPDIREQVEEGDVIAWDADTVCVAVSHGTRFVRVADVITEEVEPVAVVKGGVQ